MRAGERCLKLIKGFEILRLEPYDPIPGDGRKEPTIGYGHLIKRGEEELYRKITVEEALTLLRNDVRDAERAVEAAVKWPPRQSEFDALVSFVFNLGASRLLESTLLRLHNEGRRLDAAKQFQRWNATPGAERGLLIRRFLEAALYLEDP